MSPDQFLDYFATVSLGVDADAQFELIMGNTFSLVGHDKPYAGSKVKVSTVNARDAYRHDHHRNLFDTDVATPFEKSRTDYTTTALHSFKEVDQSSAIPLAGGGRQALSGADDPRLNFAKNTQKVTPAMYRGVRKTEDEIVEMFR